MFGESTQALLFLAIVGLTLMPTADLFMQPINQEKCSSCPVLAGADKAIEPFDARFGS